MDGDEPLLATAATVGQTNGSAAGDEEINSSCCRVKLRGGGASEARHIHSSDNEEQDVNADTNATADTVGDCASSAPYDADTEERKHFHRIVNAFKYYREHSLHKIDKNIRFIGSMPEHQQVLLHDYSRHLAQLRVCVDHNQQVIKLILRDVDQLFENLKHDKHEFMRLSRPNTSEMIKVNTVLRQIVRDWSVEGGEERRQCYQPIVDEIKRQFAPETAAEQYGVSSLSDIKVLVPGAGLGRLAYEIARLGLTCQGNEVALFMLFASNFVLNRCTSELSHRIYPWCNTHCDNLRAEHQTFCARFPDVDPSSVPTGANFSMAAGDFLEVYHEPANWHCVATCFFIDCANNIVQFIENIFHILEPGGVWINLGPLLYHFADVSGENSIEPPYSHVKDIINKVGFVFEHENINLDTSYCQNLSSMLRWSYQSVFFVCRKPKC